MAAFVPLLGEKLLTKDGPASTADVLAGRRAVALYFSAHWCPPCRGFTPQLAKWYTEMLKAKGLEVVFVSSDRDEGAFNEYFGEMPWLSLPFEERGKKEELSKKFKVQGIPTIVILDGSAGVITKDGRAAIAGDPTGADFPWKPKTLSEIMAGAQLLASDGSKVGPEALADKVYGIYFSAHWCPPCRGFTPKLAEWYSKDLKAKGMEILFVSSDRDEGAFKGYFGEMPWLALDYSDRKRKEQLSNLFGVEGIPSFVIVDKDGSTITKDGRGAVSNDPTGAEFPWYPKPVGNVAKDVSMVNETTTLIAFCEGCDAATQAAAEAAMTPVAVKFKEAAKAAGEEDPQVGFLIATESGGIAARIRGMVGFPQLPPAKHQHPMAKADGSGGWGCDGCGKSSTGERFRCTEGCDYDYCADCNAKAGEAADGKPQLLLLDIPDDGGYYVGAEGEVTTDSVTQFVDDYLAKTLSRKQLQQ